MGLSDYKKYKFDKQVQESELILSLLNRIESLEKKVEFLEGRLAAFEIPAKTPLTEDEKKKLKMLQDEKTKPEDFIKLFTGDIEEFKDA